MDSILGFRVVQRTPLKPRREVRYLAGPVQPRFWATRWLTRLDTCSDYPMLNPRLCAIAGALQICSMRPMGTWASLLGRLLQSEWSCESASTAARGEREGLACLVCLFWSEESV